MLSSEFLDFPDGWVVVLTMVEIGQRCRGMRDSRQRTIPSGRSTLLLSILALGGMGRFLWGRRSRWLMGLRRGWRRLMLMGLIL